MKRAAPILLSYVGLANLHLGADAEAIAWLRRGLEANPNYPFANLLHAAALVPLEPARQTHLNDRNQRAVRFACSPTKWFMLRFSF